MDDVSVLPEDKKQLRACLLCSLVRNTHQFKKNGCPNCEEIMPIRGSMDKVLECTSSNFDGLIGMMNPDDSWVAKWQRIEGYRRGIYAVKVSGRVPEWVEDRLAVRGQTYRPRDGSAR